MKKQKKISVTIVTRSNAQGVLDCAQGFIAQKTLPYEIVVVAPKKCLKNIKKDIVSKGRIKFKFISYKGEKNEARNLAYRNCTGEFVLFADDDMIPSRDLIEKCSKDLGRYDALVIPEHGFKGKGFLSKVFSLEKKIVMNDKDAQTPRLFEKDLFSDGTMPFDSKFGVLDEWGFYMNLMSKNPKIGETKGYLTVKNDLSLIQRIRKNFLKGKWAHNLIRNDSSEGMRRVNPIKRGLVVYSSNVEYLRREPLLFTSLAILKLSDFLTFSLGYIAGGVTRFEQKDEVES